MKKCILLLLFVGLCISHLIAQITVDVSVPSVFFLRTVNEITEGQTISSGMIIWANITSGEIRVEPADDSDIRFAPFVLNNSNVNLTLGFTASITTEDDLVRQGDRVGNLKLKLTSTAPGFESIATSPPSTSLTILDNELPCPTNGIVYVNATATGANNGGSWANAFTKLNDAIAYTCNCGGGEIWVAQGTYYPDEGIGKTDNDRNSSFQMCNGVAIYGGFNGTETQLSQRNWAANQTILSGNIGGAGNTDNAYRVINNTFTSSAPLGNTAVLDGCTIQDAYADGTFPLNLGGGMWNTYASPTIRNCIFKNNFAVAGGGLFNDNSQASVINCLFVGNTATINGSAIANGGGSDQVKVVNCTFYGNIGPITLDNESNASFVNCVIWGNEGGVDGGTVTYSIVQGGFPGTGNFNQDPLFVNAASGDFHLQACSPAIDAGTSTDAPSTDFEGNARVDAISGGSTVDIGVYEYQSVLSNDHRWYVNAAVANPGNGVSWACAFNDLQRALSVAKSGDEIWVAAGTYKPTSGTDRSISFSMKDGVAIYGGFNGTETQRSQRNWVVNVTTLSGDIGTSGVNTDNSYHVVYNNNNGQGITAVLDGFTITGGSGSGGHPNGAGGGMHNYFASPTVANCIFIDNKSGDGGGMFNFSCSPYVFNCRFSNNSANNFGGGIYNIHSPPMRVANCTFFGNSAGTHGGGIANHNSSPILTNCLLWGNSVNNSTSSTSASIYNSLSTPPISYSLIANSGGSGSWNAAIGQNDGNNIDQPPLFVDAPNGDFRLLFNSPAVNMGNNAADIDGDNGNLTIQDIATDLADNPRIFQNTVDIGAYESQLTNYNYTFIANGCDQNFIVPTTGDYTFMVRGADGGDAKSPSGPNTRAGGSGATLVATFPLQQGDILTLVAGTVNQNIPAVTNGGGGGSAIILKRGMSSTLLMVAGGGGGAVYNNAFSQGGKGGLSTDPDGLPGGGNQGEGASSDIPGGGGGGGFNTNGLPARLNLGGFAGTLAGGGSGGTGSNRIEAGGFGFGGGGGGNNSGGGGGGYSGGNGGNSFPSYSSGEGGTSYVDALGTNVTRVNGTDGGGARQNGFIQIASESTFAGVLIKPSNCTANVTEGSTTDTYTVELISPPTVDVNIALSPDAQLNVDVPMLTFTPSNWNTPQTVTLTAIDDILIEGNHTGTITHSTTSADAAYNNISVSSVTANITDNDFCPALSHGSAANYSICSADQTSDITVNTTNKNVNIKLVYFTSAQTGTDMYSGGTALGVATAPSGTNAPFSVAFNDLTFPANNTSSPFTYFVYGIADLSSPMDCRPFLEFQVTVNPLPTASVSVASTPICAGQNAVFNLTGTANAEVTYTINNGSNQTANLDGSGATTITVNNAAADQTLNLISVRNTSTNCAQNLNGSATVLVNPLPTASVSAASSPICPDQNAVFNLTGTANAEVTYTINNGGNQTTNLNANGTATITINNATVSQTLNLVSVRNTSTNCTQVLSGSAVVTVEDTEKPTFSCPADREVALNASCQITIPDLISNLTGSDNCGTVLFVQKPAANTVLTAAHQDNIVVTVIANDGNGNLDSCSVNLMVRDQTAPLASTLAALTITLDAQGQYTLTPAEVNGNSSDNCGIVEFVLSQKTFKCSDIGIQEITLVVKDAAGLADTSTVVLTVLAGPACQTSIGNAGGPSIEDPCTCSTEPGYFDEEVVITGSTNNETWVLVSNTGLIDPNTDLPYPVNTPFVSIGNNQYSLVGRHKSGEGYAIRAASSFYPDTLSIDNVCYYPEVAINGLPALVSPSAAPFMVTGTAANNAAGTGAFTLNGVAQAGAGSAPTLLTINPGTLPLGTNTLSYTFDAGAAGSKNPNDPGCVTTIQRSFQVAHCACQDVTVSLDINCQFVLSGNLVSDANCNGGTVRVMDNNPSNGNIIDCAGVWTYGLFDAFGNVICWGKVIAEDKRAPELVCAPADVTLDCYDVSYVLNNHLTIGNYGDLPSPRPAASDPARRTINNAEGVAGTGDNCQLGLIPPALVNDNIKNLGYAYFRDNCRDCGCRVNLKWSDRVVYYSCTDTAFVRSGYYAKIERQWVATDCNGMSSSYVQDIFFKRPALTDFVFNAVDADTTDKYDRVVEYNTCTPDKSLIKKEDVTPFDCSWFNTADNPRCLYIDQVECNYSVTTKDTEFPICGGKGVKIDREMYIFDWCKGGIVDTLHILIKIGDFEAPKLEYAHHAPYDISTGPMDCTAAIPVTVAGIKAQFGVTIKDNCTLGNIGVSVKTKDRYVKGILVAENVWEKVDYAVMNGMMIGLPVGTHRLIVDASDGCYNAKKDSFEFKVLDKIAPVMKCDDDLHVSLSNANGYTNGYAQVSAADIDEGSWDNCKMAWIAVRRNVPASCEASFVQKGYDSNGNGRLDAAPFDHPKDAPANFDWNTVDGVDLNGDGDIRDFGEFVATKGGKKMTPLLDFVEFFCCDLSERVTVELWGADTADDPKTLADETNYNYCWMDLLIEDKVAPTCIAPWDVTIDCDDKNIALIDDKVASSKLWGDVTITTGNDCAALDTVYSVEKGLKCGYGKIVRKWTLSKQTAKGPITITCSQTIWVRPIHQYNIRFPKDATTDCKTPSPDTVIVDELACDLLSVNVSDKRYDATGDECYKIFRTYTVINWCAYDDKCGDPMAEGNVFVVDRGLFGNNGAVPLFVLVRDDDRDLDEEFYLSTNLTANEPLASNGRSGDYHVFGDNDRNGGDSGTGYRSTDYATYAAGLPAERRQNTMPRCDAYDLSTDHFQDWEYYHSFMYTQIIKVYDDTRPVVTGVRDTFCTSPTACTANIVKVVNLKDNCSDKVTLENQYLMIAPFQTTDAGKMILYSAPRWSIRDLGNGNYEISVTNLPEGTHDLIVVGRDECGNLSLATRIPFTVKDCKAPAPICINGLSTGIMPDGNGGGMMAVWASDFVASKIYDCNGQGPETKDGLKLITKYSINRVGQAVNKDQTGLNFTCADINNSPILVELHAWDEAGNHDFCITFVELIDSRNVCAGSAALSIAGTIATEGNAKLQGASITLSGAASQSATSTAGGGYSFLNLSRGGDFTVTPQLDKNHLNGVSTFDLVLIQKHILGIQALNSPYKMIAADVNNSKSISTLDLIALRKLILNIDTHFANNTSWRFVDAAYQFPQATNPWSAAFPEVVSVNDIATNVTANFIAIKVGDVNASASVNNAAASEIRTSSNFELKTQEQNLKAGNEYKVSFSAEDLKNIQGYQFALSLDQSKVELLDIEYGVAKAENFGVFKNEGIITTSWNGKYEPGTLFTLVLRAKVDTKLSQSITLNRLVTPEAYDQNSEYLGIKLAFEGEQITDSYELKQNTPNPFNAETNIGFTLPRAMKATLSIRDVKGALIYKVEGSYAKGQNQVTLKKEQLGASGVLYYTLETTNFTATKKMVILQE